MVEVVVQQPDGLARQTLRVAHGTSIRAALTGAGHADVVVSVEAGRMGLSRHGQRAWLDDAIATPTRIEAMLPITADAKAWRHQRVAERRARTRGRRGEPAG